MDWLLSKANVGTLKLHMHLGLEEKQGRHAATISSDVGTSCQVPGNQDPGWKIVEWEVYPCSRSLWGRPSIFKAQNIMLFLLQIHAA